MSTRHKILFLLMLLLVTLLFFVHIPDGSFQARNGPTTPVNRVLGAALAYFLIFFAAQALVASLACRVQCGIVRSINLYCAEISPQSTTLRC